MKKVEKNRKLHKSVKEKVRNDFIEAGGNDGRFREKVVPDKKKRYRRQKSKKINIDEN